MQVLAVQDRSQIPNMWSRISADSKLLTIQKQLATKHGKMPTLTRQTLGRAIEEQLISAILQGRIRPGDRLVEADIAKEFDVSRGPVREALRSLAEKNLLILSPHRRARVATLGHRDAYEVYTLMAALEVLAVRFAKERLSSRFLEDLKRALRAMQAAGEQKDLVALAKADLQFNDVLFAQTAHSRLQRAWETLRFQGYILAIQYTNRVYTSLSEGVGHHQKLILLLASGTREQLESYMQQHVAWVESKFREVLDDQRIRTVEEYTASR